MNVNTINSFEVVRTREAAEHIRNGMNYALDIIFENELEITDSDHKIIHETYNLADMLDDKADRLQSRKLIERNIGMKKWISLIDESTIVFTYDKRVIEYYHAFLKSLVNEK